MPLSQQRAHRRRDEQPVLPSHRLPESGTSEQTAYELITSELLRRAAYSKTGR